MKNTVTTISLMFLILVSVAAAGQSLTPKPAPELKQWDIWIGDWTFSGTARDTPTGPEYKVDWHMHGHWILGGFFAEIDHIWKGNGQRLQQKEILYYDPIRKIQTTSGFSTDGRTWALTATFDKETSVEDMTFTNQNGTLTKCRNTWVFSSDRMALSGTQECDDGSSWKVKGTKAQPAEKK
jgi:hypothetical protein